VECLGSCGTAPVCQINNDYHENFDQQKLDRVLEGRGEGVREGGR
jgi:NADH:ubiquinone oxidoreductase subunit E